MVSGRKTLESLFDAKKIGEREKTSFNLHRPTYERFKALCARYNTTPSEAINALLADVVAEYYDAPQSETAPIAAPPTPPTQQPTPTQPPISPRGKARARPQKG
jgi:hypothetical protein